MIEILVGDLIIPKEIRYNKKLKKTEKFMLAEFYSIIKSKKIPYSARSFSSVFKVSHQTIINYIRKFEDAGFVTITGVNKNKQFIKIKLQ